MTLTDYMCQEKKEEEDLPVLENVDASIKRLENHIQTREGGLIAATRNNTDSMRTIRTTINRKKWEEKRIYGRFKRLISDISLKKTWIWLRKGNLKRETESLLVAAQINAIRTNHIKARIHKTQQNSKCRLCCDRDATINHGCGKLAQKEYKNRYDWMG